MVRNEPKLHSHGREGQTQKCCEVLLYLQLYPHLLQSKSISKTNNCHITAICHAFQIFNTWIWQFFKGDSAYICNNGQNNQNGTNILKNSPKPRSKFKDVKVRCCYIYSCESCCRNRKGIITYVGNCDPAPTQRDGMAGKLLDAGRRAGGILGPQLKIDRGVL